jgi:hypothetical protein
MQNMDDFMQNSHEVVPSLVPANCAGECQPLDALLIYCVTLG